MSERTLEIVKDDVNHGLNSRGWNRIRYDERAAWFGHFVSAIVLAVGLRPIEHMDSGAQHGSNGVFTGKVVIFTDKTIVFADAVGSTDVPRGVQTSVVARPRDGLVQLTISGGASAFGRDTFDPWPGDFNMTAEWDNGAKASFPLSPIEFAEQRQRFMDLYFTLSESLGD